MQTRLAMIAAAGATSIAIGVFAGLTIGDARVPAHPTSRIARPRGRS